MLHERTPSADGYETNFAGERLLLAGCRCSCKDVGRGSRVCGNPSLRALPRCSCSKVPSPLSLQ